MQSNRSLEGLFSSFSPDGNTYAIATSDGRLRLFDSGNGRLKVALGNKNSSSIFNSLASASVNENITSFSWIPSKEAACATASGLIVGTASGHVQLYDVQRGEIVWRTKDAKEGGVYAVSYSAGQNVILCSGRASSISIISAADGSLIRRVEASRYALTSLSLSSDHRFVLTGSSTFQLLQSDTFERVAKYTGHQNQVKTIRFVDGMDLFVSAGTGERDIAIWQAPPPAFLTRNQCRAAVSLPLERPAVHVDAVGVPDAGAEEGEKEEEEMVDAATKEQMRRLNGQFFVSAVTETGVLYVWACRAEATASVAEKGAEKGVEADSKSKERSGRVKVTWTLALKVSVQASSSASAGEVIFASKLVLQGGSPSSNSPSSFPPSSPTCTVLIARGTTAKPVFDTLAVPSYSSASSSSSSSPAEVVLASVGGLLLGKGTTAVIGAATAVKADKSIQSLPRKAHDAATIVGVLNEGLPVLQRRMAAAGSEEGKGTRRGVEASLDRKKRPLDRRPSSEDGEGAKEDEEEEEEEEEKEKEKEEKEEEGVYWIHFQNQEMHDLWKKEEWWGLAKR